MNDAPAAPQPEDPLRPLGVTELLAELNRDAADSAWPVTPSMLEADAAAGSPRAADGTVDVVRYAAWLIRESAAE